MPAVDFFITTTRRSLILVVGVQLFAPYEETLKVRVTWPCPAGISMTDENTLLTSVAGC